MAQALVESAICETCGTDIRDGSSFCYNCGESVAFEIPPPPILRPNSGLLNGGAGRGAETLAFGDAEPSPISIPPGRPDTPAPIVRKSEKLRSAASVRQRTSSRNRTKKAAEVEWVERISAAPTFIVMAILLAMFAGLMIAAALYLR